MSRMHQIAAIHIVSGLLGALAEDLEFHWPFATSA